MRSVSHVNWCRLGCCCLCLCLCLCCCAQDGVRLSDAEASLLLRYIVKIGCEPGAVGMMAGGASPMDPLFWVLHPMFEKALHVLWMSPKYRDAYSFAWIDGSCDGSRLNDPLPFTGTLRLPACLPACLPPLPCVPCQILRYLQIVLISSLVISSGPTAFGSSCAAFGSGCAAFGSDCAAFGSGCAAFGSSCTTFGSGCTAFGVRLSRIHLCHLSIRYVRDRAPRGTLNARTSKDRACRANVLSIPVSRTL